MSSSTLQLEAAPKATNIDFGEGVIRVSLKDGRVVQVPLAWYPRLEFATTCEREKYEFFNDGSVIRWPDIDEDLRITDLLAGRASRESGSSLDRWKQEKIVRRSLPSPQPWGIEASMPTEDLPS